MTTNRIVAVAGVATAALYLYLTSLIPSGGFTDVVGPRVYPCVLGVVLLLAGCWMLVFDKPAASTGEAAGDKSDEPPSSTNPVMTSGVIVCTLVYVSVLEPLGFVTATTAYTFALMAYFHRGRWTVNAISSVAFSIISYTLLSKLLGANLPAGILPF